MDFADFAYFVDIADFADFADIADFAETGGGDGQKFTLINVKPFKMNFHFKVDFVTLKMGP